MEAEPAAASDTVPQTPSERADALVEPLGGKRRYPSRGRKGRSAQRRAGQSRQARTGSTLSVTQGNPLALSRQEMGILTKRLLVLALSDITKDDLTLEPIRITAWEYAQLFNNSCKSIY